MILPANLQSIINKEFREQSLSQLRSLTPESIQIFDNSQIPFNYTIVAHPDGATTQTLLKVQNQLKAIDPEQYYYPPSQFHLTLLGNIGINKDEYAIKQAIRTTILAPLEFVLYGLGSNTHCASLSAYPYGFSMIKTRETLRSKIGDHGDDYSIHLPAYEQVGWINFMRYLQTPQKALLDKLYGERSTYFGTFAINEISIYLNSSKVLDPHRMELISTIGIRER